MALEVLDARGVAERLERHEPRLPAEAHYEALHQLVHAVEGVVSWMLFNDLTRRDVGAFVETYREPLQTLRSGIEGMLPAAERRRFKRRTKQLGKLGFGAELAAEIASLDYLPSSVGVIEVSRRTGVGLEEAATRFYALGERLSLGWLRDGLAHLPTQGSWEKIAAVGLVMDLREAQRKLATAFIEARKQEDGLSAEGFLGAPPAPAGALRRGARGAQAPRSVDAGGRRGAGQAAGARRSARASTARSRARAEREAAPHGAARQAARTKARSRASSRAMPSSVARRRVPSRSQQPVPQRVVQPAGCHVLRSQPGLGAQRGEVDPFARAKPGQQALEHHPVGVEHVALGGRSLEPRADRRVAQARPEGPALRQVGGGGGAEPQVERAAPRAPGCDAPPRPGARSSRPRSARSP